MKYTDQYIKDDRNERGEFVYNSDTHEKVYKYYGMENNLCTLYISIVNQYFYNIFGQKTLTWSAYPSTRFFTS